jgi:hypothetical protein
VITVAWQLAKIAAVVAVLGVAFALLPDADPDAVSTFTVPSFIWAPIAAVMKLNGIMPFIGTLLAIATLSLAIRVGMVGLWLYSWITSHVFSS